MMSQLTLENTMPGRAERQRIREHAELIVAEARVLREQLDRTWGAVGLELPGESLRADACSLGSPTNRRLQLS